jgi:outer membrane protein
LRKILIAILTTLSLKAGGLVDIQGGAGVWLVGSTGEVVYRGDPIDFEDHLGMDGSLASYGYIDVQHFIPVIPNVRIDVTQFGEEADKNIPSGVQKEFSDRNLTGQVKSNINLNQFDIVAYYNLIGTVLHADVGFGVKYYQGSIDIDSRYTNNDTVDVDFAVPILYGRVGATIPGTNVSAFVDMKYMKFSPSINLEVVDMSAKVQMTPLDIFVFDVNIEAGYRVHRLQVLAQDSSIGNFNADIKTEISGFFGGINIKF